MAEQAPLRNIERIQETDEASKTPKAVTAALVVLGGACVVFAAMALGGRHSTEPSAKVDPLGDLVATKSKGGGASGPTKATDLSTSDVTFPGILSDDGKPTTALAAVRGNSPAVAVAPAAVMQAETVPGTSVPPAPSDRLSVMPLPAQNVLDATPLVTRPRDGLTKAAADSAQLTTPSQATSGAGHDGGYQLQVSSFRTQPEANTFADQLRARGHKSYVVEAKVPGRGTWYRVRIGPFASQHAAAAYRTGFEQKEHVVPFIVPPATAK
jgi:hypothetical protein